MLARKQTNKKISPGLTRDEIILTSDHEKTEPFNSFSTFTKNVTFRLEGLR